MTGAGGGGGGGAGAGDAREAHASSSSSSSCEDQVPLCDDLHRRRNWRHQTLFSGHGRDACGYFGIRGVLSQRTGFVRFIKTYFVVPPNQDQGPLGGAAMADGAPAGGGGVQGNGTTHVVDAAWTQGYDGRDPRKRTPGQWEFPEGEVIDESEEEDDDDDEDELDGLYHGSNVTDGASHNGEDEDFWDVDTFGWCYRGYLDDGGDDGRRQTETMDRSGKGSKRAKWPASKTAGNDNDENNNSGGDDNGDEEVRPRIGGAGILGKWCDMHGGGPFWLFHRDLDEFY
ncbi:hypothetical protein DFQ26_003367 [Actinomortierella ambigua]|nr:hypothetical protein DFQ26_003367 [Actinomortierella ambigua]